MAAISFVSSNHQPANNGHHHHHHHHGPVTEEIEGLIRVFKDGCVERPAVVPTVPPTTSDPAKVTARDIILPNDTCTRVYVPGPHTDKPSLSLPLLVYFHGGGFCVGSAAWSCYHEFLANLAVKARCVIVSANYRLAPENRLPAAYDDGFNVISWIKQQALDHNSNNRWWLSRCNLSRLFLAGDSAGANIVYHVAIRLTTSGTTVNPLTLMGTILIQPFFGGESRTASEKHSSGADNKSALTLSASDTYWRLALPRGATRDHQWCNPQANTAGFGGPPELPRTLVCVSEMDILKDRNLEFCKALKNAGKKVEALVYGGVGHSFQILYNSPMSYVRVQEMLSHLQNFINQP